MITKEKKKEAVDELSAIIKDNDSVFFTDFSGLSTPELDGLKSKLRELGASYKVSKKSLWPFIMRRAGREDIDFSNHKGSIGVVYSNEEEAGIAKAIKEFSKKHGQFGIMGGLLKKVFISPERVSYLASLPSYEQLLAMFTSTVNAPRQGLVGVLSANIRNLVSVVSNIKDKKS